MPANRTYVFVDGDNLIASAKSIGITLDFARLRSKIEQKFGGIDRISFYSSDLMLKPNQQKLAKTLSDVGYQLFLEQKPFSSADVRLTTDAMALVTEYDTIVLLSGDSDFAPMLHNLAQQGKRTVVISLKIASKKLIEFSAEFYELESILSTTEIEKPKRTPLKSKEYKTPVAHNLNRPLRVFLCHSSSDKATVRDLYKRLSREQNISPWLDEKDILPGQVWDAEINRAIRDADVVLVCCSHTSITKEGYVQKEIVRALDIADEKPEETIFIIPLKLDDCDVPNRLRRWQWVNYFDETGYEQLMRSLRYRAERLKP